MSAGFIHVSSIGESRGSRSSVSRRDYAKYHVRVTDERGLASAYQAPVVGGTYIVILLMFRPLLIENNVNLYKVHAWLLTPERES